jgi:hypothetical protein
MRKLLFGALVCVALLQAGCVTLDDLKAYRAACLADPACVERSQGVQDRTEAIVSTGVALIPHPLAPVAAKPAGKVAGVVFEFFAILIFGRAILKKQAVK